MENKIIDKIVIVNSELGTTIKDSGCPFWYSAKFEKRSCKIKDIKCRYGATEIILPFDCPLHTRTVTMTVSSIRLNV